MEKLSPFYIEDHILPVILEKIWDFVEINDIESTEKYLDENKKYFDQVELNGPTIKTLFYPAYILAFLLNNKEFCYRYMLKVGEVTRNYDFQQSFFEQYYGPYNYWQRLTPETVPIPLTEYCDILTALFLEKLHERLKKYTVENDIDELIKIIREHSTLLNLLQYNRQAIDCCFNLYQIRDNIELQKPYFNEIDSIIGIIGWTEHLFITDDDPEYSLNLYSLKISDDDRKRLSLTGKFLVEKLCRELTDSLDQNDVDTAIKILEDHEEIINEINMYDGAIKKYFEPIYQNAIKYGYSIFADKFLSKITEIVDQKK